ncbi:hypothetical protein I6A60_32055 [Frankia sp. AgB1.9]|uniref:hypothetical protein n=1 Tax=unclassified Frankia TaxID=2632575 RepID=UPI001931C7B7|nr:MULTISPECIES: hypothetical protein [unclassified Frankia]MBL7494231.1 hypothetical protein [Frankia sp. AgW1.1]MBL7552462.1 hypothetical protein [Frankia sp. AgB1.9]MBL7623564.1 hypothetical protein [Frankia sp. AgB1.8]
MNVKVMLAGGVGYLLGRTKKGKAAVKFALWAGGHDANVKDLARGQALKLLDSDEGRKLVAQVRGPVLASGRKAALSAYEHRVGSLTESLSHRTAELRHSLDETPAAELGGVAGTLTGTLNDTFSRWGTPHGAEPDGDAARAESDETSAESDEMSEPETAAPGREAASGEASDAEDSDSDVPGGQAAESGADESPDEPDTASGERRSPRQDAVVAGNRRPPSRHLDFRPAAKRPDPASAASKKRARAASSAR